MFYFSRFVSRILQTLSRHLLSAGHGVGGAGDAELKKRVCILGTYRRVGEAGNYFIGLFQHRCFLDEDGSEFKKDLIHL